MVYKVLVTGGRKYQDYEVVKDALDALNPDIVIHGDAPGADSLADWWAKENGKKVESYPISPED